MKLLSQIMKLSRNFNPCQKLCLHRHFSSMTMEWPIHKAIKGSVSGLCQSLPRDPVRSCVKRCVLNRSLSTSSTLTARTNVGVGSQPHHSEDYLHQSLSPPSRVSDAEKATGSVPDSAWLLRLANDNGFLSFCRNSYLASAVGCGMQAEGAFEISQVAAQGVFLLAAFNLLWGTSTYVIYIITLRRRIHMSVIAALVHISGAVLHLLVWLALVIMYLGLTEEPPEDPHDGENI